MRSFGRKPDNAVPLAIFPAACMKAGAVSLALLRPAESRLRLRNKLRLSVKLALTCRRWFPSIALVASYYSWPGIRMIQSEHIATALAGWTCQHYNGRTTATYRSRWKAAAHCLILGEGWFVREVREPLFILPRAAEAAADFRPRSSYSL